MTPEGIACSISDMYLRFEQLRAHKMREWEEIQRYVFATDTTQTSNKALPWSNKTTIPKLCQIRDNLVANYVAALFPKRKWIMWEADSEADSTLAKKKAVEQYMDWVVDRNEFHDEVTKLVTDYVDYGNCFATIDWVDKTSAMGDGTQRYGYVGPVPRRISPVDIVFDPTVSAFEDAPKVVRSYTSIGELKKKILKQAADLTNDAEAQALRDLANYLEEYRSTALSFDGSVTVKDAIYEVAGFSSWRDYLASGTCEVLTFYGDIYDPETGSFQENRIITVVDRHRVVSNIENPSYLGKSVIFHAGWRIRPDALWAMGPLDNLVGMQYRIDHLENMKADVFDLIAYPLIKVKGSVEDFEWKPFERIYTSEEGDIELISPPFQVLAADNQIGILEAKMEEMAGSPREAMGFRTPGEKTMYEVQRLEMAAGRIFQAKIVQFERQIVEELLNAMLEVARRRISNASIRVFDNDLKVTDFQSVTPEDISGNGRIRPVAARHFAEKSTMVQNINSFFGSAIGSDPLVRAHFSTVKLAKVFEYLLDLDQFQLVMENIRISEQAEAQQLANSAAENVAVASQTPAGIVEGDVDPEELQ